MASEFLVEFFCTIGPPADAGAHWEPEVLHCFPSKPTTCGVKPEALPAFAFPRPRDSCRTTAACVLFWYVSICLASWT